MDNKINRLIGMYKSMSEAQLQEEIDAIFDIVWALLETQECDSIETYPNPQIRLKISCEVLQHEGNYVN